jgi:hypothetical protein
MKWLLAILAALWLSGSAIAQTVASALLFENGVLTNSVARLDGPGSVSEFRNVTAGQLSFRLTGLGVVNQAGFTTSSTTLIVGWNGSVITTWSHGQNSNDTLSGGTLTAFAQNFGLPQTGIIQLTSSFWPGAVVTWGQVRTIIGAEEYFGPLRIQTVAGHILLVNSHLVSTAAPEPGVLWLLPLGGLTLLIRRHK